MTTFQVTKKITEVDKFIHLGHWGDAPYRELFWGGDAAGNTLSLHKKVTVDGVDYYPQIKDSTINPATQLDRNNVKQEQAIFMSRGDVYIKLTGGAAPTDFWVTVQ